MISVATTVSYLLLLCETDVIHKKKKYIAYHEDLKKRKLIKSATFQFITFESVFFLVPIIVYDSVIVRFS